jgi:hypothetical protein
VTPSPREFAPRSDRSATRRRRFSRDIARLASSLAGRNEEGGHRRLGRNHSKRSFIVRIASFILGLLGAAGALFLGIKWQGDMSSPEGQAAMQLAAALGKEAGAGGLGAEMAGLQRGTYALLICGALGLVFSIVVLLRKGNRFGNAALLIVCGVLPILFAGKAVLGVPMALAGLFALAVKPKLAV